MPLVIIHPDKAGDIPEFSKGETALLTVEDVSFKLGEVEKGNGVLVISTSRILFSSKSEKYCVAFDYPFVILHAVSTEENCIYCQLDSENVDECWFTPSDKTVLEPMFKQIAEGSAMNSDPLEKDENDIVGDEDAFDFDIDVPEGTDQS